MANKDLHPHASVEDGDMKEKPKKRRGLKWFIIDLWWVHLIVLVLGVVVVTLPVVYVLYPKIAKSQVKSATLDIVDLAITDPRPEMVHVNLTTRLGTKSIFRPSLKAFNGTLELPNGGPFLTVPVPDIAAKNGRLINIDTDVPIRNMTGFTEFAKALVANESVTSILAGTGKLQLGKLPKVDVSYDKPLTTQGLSGLKGTQVSDLELLLTTQPDGATLSGKAKLPNPSVQTAQLGLVTLDIAIPGSSIDAQSDLPIGYAMINNLLLVPGDNNVDVRSVTNQTLLIQVLLANPSFLTNGLPVILTGKDVVYNGQSISYLVEALKDSPIQQTLSVGEAITNAGLGGIFSNAPGKKLRLRKRSSMKEKPRRDIRTQMNKRAPNAEDDDLNGWIPAIKTVLSNRLL